MEAWDIAWEGGDLWVACDAPGYPILKYNGSSVVIDQIPSSLVPSATGLTMDDSGYLWASDNVNQKIYKIDPYATGVGDGDASTFGEPSIAFSGNPFSGILQITVSGFAGPADILVFDSSGRLVLSAEAEQTLTWDTQDRRNSPLPPGVYTVIASDGGSSASGRAVLIR